LRGISAANRIPSSSRKRVTALQAVDVEAGH